MISAFKSDVFIFYNENRAAAKAEEERHMFDIVKVKLEAWAIQFFRSAMDNNNYNNNNNGDDELTYTKLKAGLAKQKNHMVRILLLAAFQRVNLCWIGGNIARCCPVIAVIAVLQLPPGLQFHNSDELFAAMDVDKDRSATVAMSGEGGCTPDAKHDDTMEQ